MSIAVSAVVVRSRFLAAAAAAMSLLLVAVGATLAAHPFMAWGLVPRVLLVMLCAGSAIALIRRTRIDGKTFRLDISGLGQFRLSEDIEAKGGAAQKTPHEEEGQAVRLLENPVLWPHLMVLRLDAGNGRVHVLLILPDCTGAEEFRALQVACRAIARRSSPFTCPQIEEDRDRIELS